MGIKHRTLTKAELEDIRDVTGGIGPNAPKAKAIKAQYELKNATLDLADVIAESAEKLQESIDEFNRNSGTLQKWIIAFTAVIAIATIVNIFIRFLG